MESLEILFNLVFLSKLLRMFISANLNYFLVIFVFYARSALQHLFYNAYVDFDFACIRHALCTINFDFVCTGHVFIFTLAFRSSRSRSLLSLAS